MSRVWLYGWLTRNLITVYYNKTKKTINVKNNVFYLKNYLFQFLIPLNF